MTKIKRFLRRGLRWPVKFLRKFDRKVQRSLTKIFRTFYKVKFLRPITKPVYRFVHYHHRITASMLLILILAGVAIPIAQPYLRDRRYELNTQARGLLGEADKDLTKKLTFDDKNQVFQFNKDAKKAPTTEGNPLEKLKSQVGGAGEEDEQLYSVDVSKDLSKGVAYYDNQMELSFKLTPQFNTMPGEQKDGHLIYPLNGAKGQLAYTVDATGMKENVVLYKSPGDTFKMSYKLDLPKSLEARLIPGTGEVGIYSADPALFGNISYGSSDDQTRVENARNNSEKTYLTFKIPAPVVMGVGKTNQKSIAPVDSKFELRGNTLSVVTKGLDKAEYPLSIDPTITVDSSSDFQTGNMDDNNLSVSSGDLNRGALTGGSMASSWSTGTNFPVNIGYNDAVAYNGFLYVLGGWDGDNIVDDVRFAAINATTGSIGGWSYTSDILGTRADHKSFAYNGYMYVLGGSDNSDTLHNDVRYAPINPTTGALGEWDDTSSFDTPRGGHAAAVYNGYMYVSGGEDANDDFLSDVQYAPINANGTVGTWQPTTTMSDSWVGHSFTAYNGYMYRVGGDWTETVEYAPINPTTGALGSWVSTTSMPSVRYAHGTAIYNGYLYVSGGSGNGGAGGSYGQFSSTQYAPINANGTVGTWQTTTALPTTRAHGTAVAYNGYFYYIGGDNDVTGPMNQIRYAQINPAGYVDANTTTTFTTAVTSRSGHATVVYNNFVYLIGGGVSTVVYTSLNADGTIGTWLSATSLPVGAANPSNHSAEVYNGRIYVVASNGTTYYAAINANGSLAGSWTTGSPYSPSRAYFDTAEYNGYLYMAGGEYCSGVYCSDLQYAPINANGSLGAWVSASYGLPHTNSGLQLVAYGGYLYTLGGYSTDGALYAPIQSNGDIGNWQTTNTFATPYTYSHKAVAYNGYMYVSGGYAANTYFGYAKINANGGLDSWQSLPNLPDTRVAHSMIVSSNRIYIIAGSSTNPTNVYYRTIQNGGSGAIGAWSSTTNLAASAYYHAAVAYNNYLYVLDGSTIRYISIGRDGKLGVSWSTTANPSSRSSGTLVAYNGYLYALGGTATNSAQYTAINPTTGGLNTWANATSLTSTRLNLTAVAYNGYMYVMGGQNGATTYDTVQYATINSSTGALGGWTTGTTLTSTRYRLTSFAYNGYIYVMGGNTGSATLNTVQYATINSSTGALGGWTTTTSFITPRYYHTSVVYNGYVYVMGGNTSYLSDIQYAPINSNGTLGAWSSTTSLTSGRYGHAAVAYNGYIYTLGGLITGGGPALNTVQYATLNSIARKASYSKVIDLGTNSNVTDLSYTGTLPKGLSNISYRMASSTGVFGETRSAVPPLSCSSGQYIQLFVALDNSEGGVFPDAGNAANAKLSSITVDSSPSGTPPDKRLRHGAWFSNEVLQPFESATSEQCS